MQGSSRWTTAAILTVALLVCLAVGFSFLPGPVFGSLPEWAQRYFTPGAGRHGGPRIALEVDKNAVLKEQLATLRDDVRRVVREARVGITGAPVVRGNAVELRIRDTDVQQAVAKLQELSLPVGGSGAHSLDVATGAEGLITLTLTEQGILDHLRQAVEKSITVVERRIGELGTGKPSILRDGVDRILVQVPGLQDPQRLKELVGKTAKLEFRLVDQSMTPEQALSSRPPPVSEILYGVIPREGRVPYLIEKRVVVSGADLNDAQPGFDQRTREPIVNFRFNASGTRRFALVTQENVGRPFAIVLDGDVISAPVIREPILGGSGQISGGFTVTAANDLAILLRAGALPAPLTIIEQTDASR